MSTKRSEIREKRERIIQEKKQKLKKLEAIQKMINTRQEKDGSAEIYSPNKILSEVNTLFSNLGEKPVKIIYRDANGKEGGIRSGKKHNLNVVKSIGVVSHNPQFMYKKEIQTTNSFLQEQREKELEQERKKNEEPKEEKKMITKEIATQEEEEEEEEPIDFEEIIKEKEFTDFFSKSSKLVERILSNKVDPLIDYSEEEMTTNADEKLILENTFECDFTKDRCVTMVNFCSSKNTNYQNLFVGSYFKKHYGSISESSGIVVWNSLLPNRPEYIFESENPVSQVMFHKYSPNLIIGGTYLGEILMWDMRSGKKEAVQRSTLKFKSHSYPINGLKMIGTSVSHSLLSMDSMGSICEWNNCDITKEPTLVQIGGSNSTGIRHKEHSNDISTICLSYKKDTFDKFFIGDENGSIYSVYLYGTKEGIDQKMEGHYGSITGLDFHSNSNFSDYFLTSSIDWSVFLWNQKKKSPIYSFTDFDNYVLDVQWSPVHPSLFATVDASGYLKLWDLNKDTETPIFKVQVSNVKQGERALNKLSWSATGSHIICGGITGKIYLYRVDDDTAKPADNESSSFRSTLLKLDS